MGEIISCCTIFPLLESIFSGFWRVCLPFSWLLKSRIQTYFPRWCIGFWPKKVVLHSRGTFLIHHKKIIWKVRKLLKSTTQVFKSWFLIINNQLLICIVLSPKKPDQRLVDRQRKIRRCFFQSLPSSEPVYILQKQCVLFGYREIDSVFVCIACKNLSLALPKDCRAILTDYLHRRK